MIKEEIQKELEKLPTIKGLMYYKGYSARIGFSEEDNCFYGIINNIDDLVSFEADEFKNIEKEFHDAVDDYLKCCVELGKEVKI